MPLKLILKGVSASILAMIQTMDSFRKNLLAGTSAPAVHPTLQRVLEEPKTWHSRGLTVADGLTIELVEPSDSLNWA
jgi:hypothetical protein